ncbi:hypothetical protein GCM10007391_13260 [Alteromonas halophila]|uniref:Uncharacterized protein n=1 Tax=Alteromonas halophila TaxID=516698 RepID=A0A918JL72_9ALTE|nr:hypothetical protein GCM10007391_13260 [Alteromonas halophila]
MSACDATYKVGISFSNWCGDFDGALNEVREQLVYLKPSWYCLFAGMGRLPRTKDKPRRIEGKVTPLVNRYFPTA